MQKLERTTFETSRAAEYFDVDELQTQTGQPLSNFAAVALKELVDNALDACETAKVAPEVGIEVCEEEGLIQISVSDNGPGIPAEVVRKILNFDTRTLDKAAYRAPTRGAQGNALKTVLGIPHALGCAEPVIIEAQGVRHSIRARVDPAGELRIAHGEEQRNGVSGTQVSLALPREEQDFDPDHWARAFALYNPHATVKIRLEDENGDLGISEEHETADFYHPTQDFPGEFRKYLPTDPTSAHWYDPAALKRLVFSHIRHHERSGGRDLPLREFVRQFKGLSATRKAKAVCDAFPQISHLSDFENEPEEVAELLAGMKEHSNPPSHNVLGVVGEEHFRRCFEKWYGVERFGYKKVKGYLPSGLPYIFEFALAGTEVKGELFTAVNYSPTFGDPLTGTRFVVPEISAFGIQNFLIEGHASPDYRYAADPRPPYTAAAVHIITPAPLFLDRGKTRLLLEEDDDA